MWTRLQREEPFLRLGLVEQDSSFWSWGLCERLCQLSLEIVGREPETGLHLAELAVAVAKNVDGWQGIFTTDAVAELQQLAFAHLGNALRVLGDHRAAEAAFARPTPAASEGGSDCLDYRPRILSLRASFLFAVRLFDEAWIDLCALLDIAGHREEPLSSLMAIAHIQRAHILSESDQLQSALGELEKAKALAPRTETKTHRNIALDQLAILTQTHYQEAAEELVPRAEQLLGQEAAPVDWVRLDWIKARILAGRGQVAEAEEALLAVGAKFLELGRSYDAALADLERATLLFEQSKWAEVEALAADMIAVFEAHEIHREALAALSLFRDAAASRELTKSFLGQLTGYWHKAQSQSGLRFEPQDR